ncbi:hypothetical protein SNEBB_003254 [Seison nebaliae]|nr:hypothetical protein SNEBB_003254 [Seison nebaliae]
MSLIVSSTYLMESIRAIPPITPEDYCRDMNKVIDCMMGVRTTAGPIKIRPSDILRKGICDTADNIKFIGQGSVAGDYIVLKTYLSCNKSFEMNLDKLQTYGILTPEVHKRLELLLSKLMKMDNIVYAPNDSPFSFLYNDNLKLLTLQLPLEKVDYDYLSPKPFDKNYYKEIGHDTINELDRKLSKEHIEPNVILMWFRHTPNLRIHDRTFLLLAEHMDALTRYPRFSQALMIVQYHLASYVN